jgi:hypothetical protein
VTPLLAIRLAMMAGVLLFGAVSWFMHQAPEWTPTDPAVAARLRTMGGIVGGIAALGLVVLFTRFRDASSPSQASTLAILAWALGEAVALFGGVVFFLTGAPTWYIVGVLLLTLTFVAFPPPAHR